MLYTSTSAGCSTVSCVQARRHGVQLPAWSSSSVPCGIVPTSHNHAAVSGPDRHRHYSCRAVNAKSHSRWPCFSSGRCTGLECIAFVGQNIIDVLGVSSPAENTAIQGILWRPDMIALSVCCTTLTANIDITFCTVPLKHFLRYCHYNLNIYNNKRSK